MNPIQAAFEAAIAKEASMTEDTGIYDPGKLQAREGMGVTPQWQSAYPDDDATDRMEGYADGQANNYQHKRGPIYDHAWWEGSCDAIRLTPPRVQPSLWARLRAWIGRVFW